MAKRKRSAARRRPSPKSVLASGRQPEFEALTTVINVPPTKDARAVIRDLANRVGLGRAHLEAVTADGSEWEIEPRARIAVGRAWDLAAALRAQPEVVHAEPMFRYLVPENVVRPAPRAAAGVATHDPATDNEFDWSLRKANVLDAWPLFGARPPGAGIRVGHPDTGYTPHPELADPGRLLITEGWDFDDDDANPIDDLNADFLDNPSHGTGTGSVILSGVGPAAAGPGPFVSGAAPHALLIPIRTTETVVLFSMRNLRRALDHATTHGVHVVSISLGGPFPGFGTSTAITRAIDAGTIVLAAAGNEIGFVVFPAAFEDVIAVAATNIRDVPWTGSSHGPAVDISAPGESVWRALTQRNAAGQFQFSVERGTGTSFAVATTAGAAALWVSFHGWASLVRHYGAASVARVFKYLLQATSRRPSGWDTTEYGAGIVDARRLLREPLPAVAPARKLHDARRASVATDTTGIETLVHLLPGVSRTRIEELLAEMLHVPDRALATILQDHGAELAFQLAMQPAVLDSLRRATRGGKAAAAGRQTVRRKLSTASLSSRLRRQLARG
jgi:serine protease